MNGESRVREATALQSKCQAAEPTCDSGLKYKTLFQGAGVAIWDCDFSEIHQALEEVRRITPDVRGYIAGHPDLVRQLIRKIHVRDVNEYALLLYRAQSKEELTSRMEELFPPESESVFAEEFLSLYEGKRIFQDQKTVRSLDGERLCVLVSVTAAPSQHPLENVIVTLVDVTAQARASEALLESEAKFRDIFELNAVPMILWDAGGHVLQGNQAFLQVTGHTREAIEGGGLFCEMLVAEARWPVMAAAKIRALEQGKFEPFEEDLVTRDGTRIPVLLSGGSLAGRSDRGVTFVLDLREKKRAAEAVRRKTVYARLLRDVAIAANAASEPGDVLGHCLGMLCGELGFPIGHVLLIRDAKIVSSGIWHCAEEDRPTYAEFMAISPGMAGDGTCIVAESVHAGTPVWLRPAERKSCDRARAASDAGIAMLVVLPLLAQGEPVAALEFGSVGEMEQDDDLARTLVALGTELSRVFERQRARADLQKREELYRTLVENLPNGYVLVFDRELRCVFADGKELGLPKESATGLKVAEIIGSDFSPEFSDACAGALEGRSASFELVMKTGKIHNVDVTPIGNDGKLGMVISHDITAMKSSELALRDSEQQLRGYAERLFVLARRLIKAHEEERTRIARELHDDFNQRVAAACISLSNLLNDQKMSRAEMRKQLAGVKEVISGLSHDIRSMSHSLHPIVLEHMGAAAALRSQCEEFRRLHKTPVQFECDCQECLNMADEEVSICLYRVLQEALTNVRKHSGAAHVAVSVMAVGRQVEMRVHDDGAPFDPLQARSKGLGLTNMEERVRLLGGTFSVASERGKGNEITATIPLDTGRSATRESAGEIAEDGLPCVHSAQREQEEERAQPVRRRARKGKRG